MKRLTKKDDSGNWCLRGMPWKSLYIGNPMTQEAYEKLYGALWKLMEYEDTGLTPEEVMDGKMLTGWIPVEERLPEREEWMGTKGEEHYLRRMEIAVMSDTLEYFLVFYDGYKWFDKFGRTYAGVKAWKIHEPFNPQN